MAIRTASLLIGLLVAILAGNARAQVPGDTCGLFGADADHAKDWGSLALAGDVGPATPASAPEWLAKLFPHTSQPNRFLRRFRRLEATEYDVHGRLAGSVIVELKYPGLDGRDETGQACVFLPPHLRDEPSRRVPLIHNAGYEIDAAGAAELVAKGCAVSTVHAHPLNPLGRGVNLDRAILHAVRRLPCIDPLRVSIQGGSAGGWMTLMLAADNFPLVWATPDVPPIHWGYNAAYIARHVQMAAPPAGQNEPRLPVLLAVGPIAEQSKMLYGMPFESETFLAVSPLAHLDTITVPTLDQLTMPKLERLMRRLRGESWRPFRIRPGGMGAVITANQLDYPEAERADVLLGLTAFAMNDACATRLAQFYARLPAEWKVLGPRLGDGTPAGTRAALHDLAESSR